MRVVLLGYGGWVSDPLSGHTSVLVSGGSDGDLILLDSGEGVLRSMFECGYTDIGRLRAVVLTHSHGDHILGLPTIVQFAKVLGARFKVVGRRETLESLRKLLEATSVSGFECCTEFVEVGPGDSVELAGLRVEFAEALHTVPSLAVRVEDREAQGCLVYTGDTAYSEHVVRLARGCDLLLHEASFPDPDGPLARSLGHSTVSDCLRAAAEAGVRLVVPLHLGLAGLKLDPARFPAGVTVVRPTRCLTIEL